MRTRADPSTQALIDEAYRLPECAARDALLERAASCAEALDDLETAWRARCDILNSSSAHEAPRFETLFLCLAWCLAVSDRDPERFSPGHILWQYKWVATEAPAYAQVPRTVLERIVSDMDERFVKAGWGRRAGVHKRLELMMLLGEHDEARALVEQWRRTPRDRGSDCNACETDCMAELLALLGEDEQAVRAARPIVQGRLRCATVPHSTFGKLLLPMTRLKKHDTARELYDRGRRLLASTEEGGCKLASPYLTYAAFINDVQQATGILRNRLAQAVSLRADLARMRWFGHAAAAAGFLQQHGLAAVELPRVPGLTEEGENALSTLHERLLGLARHHAAALDRRNANSYYSTWLDQLPGLYGEPAN